MSQIPEGAKGHGMYASCQRVDARVEQLLARDKEQTDNYLRLLGEYQASQAQVEALQRENERLKRQADGQCDGCSQQLEDAFCSKCLQKAKGDSQDVYANSINQALDRIESLEATVERLKAASPTGAQMIRGQLRGCLPSHMKGDRA